MINMSDWNGVQAQITEINEAIRYTSLRLRERENAANALIDRIKELENRPAWHTVNLDQARDIKNLQESVKEIASDIDSIRIEVSELDDYDDNRREEESKIRAWVTHVESKLNNFIERVGGIRVDNINTANIDSIQNLIHENTNLKAEIQRVCSIKDSLNEENKGLKVVNNRGSAAMTEIQEFLKNKHGGKMYCFMCKTLHRRG